MAGRTTQGEIMKQIIRDWEPEIIALILWATIIIAGA